MAFDEPTATLAPQEAVSLFALLQTLVQNGATIVFVTHKLREVMAYSQAVSVLRGGRNVGDFLTAQITEQDLLLRMIGAKSAMPLGARSPLTGESDTTYLSGPAPAIPTPGYVPDVSVVFSFQGRNGPPLSET